MKITLPVSSGEIFALKCYRHDMQLDAWTMSCDGYLGGSHTGWSSLNFYVRGVYTSDDRVNLVGMDDDTEAMV